MIYGSKHAVQNTVIILQRLEHRIPFKYLVAVSRVLGGAAARGRLRVGGDGVAVAVLVEELAKEGGPLLHKAVTDL